MARRVMDLSHINSKRMAIMAKGYMSKKDLMDFVPCGKNKAREIYEAIRKDTEARGLENLSNIVLAERVLEYLGLTASSIAKNAKIEKELN